MKLVTSLHYCLSCGPPSETSGLVHFHFGVSRRENAVVWLIGEYVSLVESEVVLKNNILSRKKLIDHLIAKQFQCQNMCLPDIGFIPEQTATGIG